MKLLIRYECIQQVFDDVEKQIFNCNDNEYQYNRNILKKNNFSIGAEAKYQKFRKQEKIRKTKSKLFPGFI